MTPATFLPTARAWFSVALGLAQVGAFAACPSDPRLKDAHDVVATVNGKAMTRAYFTAELTRAGVARNADPAVRRQVARRVLDRLIDEELAVGAARAAHIVISPADVHREAARVSAGYPAGTFERVLNAEQLTHEDYLTRIQRQLAVDAYFKQAIAGEVQVTDDDVRARYAETRAKTTRPAQVRARQILVKTAEEAQYLRGEILAKRISMEDAASRYSEAPDKDQGGDLGWFAAAELPPVFDVCFSLAEGAISDVIASDYGFHIFQVIDRRPAGTPSFSRAKSEIRRELRREREHSAIERLRKRLRAAAQVVIDQAAVDAAVALLPDPPDDAAAPPAGGEQRWGSFAGKQAAPEQAPLQKPSLGASPSPEAPR